jgi:V/A-type H+-transporting ATPase subunit E
MTTRFVLKDALQQEIDREAKSLREEARRKGEEVLEEARLRRETMKREAAQQLEQEVEIRSRRTLAKTRLEGRNALLQVKKRAIDRAFDEAGQSLTALAAARSDRYRELILALFQRARALLPKGPLRVRAGTAEAELLGPALKGRDIEVILEQGRHGILLETSDGRIRCDDSFQALLDRTRPEREAELEAILFEEDYEAGQG